MRPFLRETLGILLLAIVIFLLLQTTVRTFVVVGSSMEPSFQDGQRLLINKVVYAFHEPERGDVIIFYPPDKPKVLYIKRLIALPGDTVEVKMGTVYVNGTKLIEPYVKEPPEYTIQQKEIPDDNYFVLGDNRNNSRDSHTNWTVPRQNMVGKVWLSIWPPSQWRLIPDYSLQEQIAASN